MTQITPQTNMRLKTKQRVLRRLSAHRARNQLVELASEPYCQAFDCLSSSPSPLVELFHGADLLMKTGSTTTNDRKKPITEIENHQDKRLLAGPACEAASSTFRCT
jgi:hypothetical protein